MTDKEKFNSLRKRVFSKESKYCPDCWAAMENGE